MFPGTYFAPAYFASSYFPRGAGAGGMGYFPGTYFAPNFFAGTYFAGTGTGPGGASPTTSGKPKRWFPGLMRRPRRF